jgi:hypothetical protein
MDQKAIVLYLCMKWMALDAIHQDLVETLGEKGVAYSTVTKYVRSSRFTRDKDTAPPEPMDVGLNAVDQAILTALAHDPFFVGAGTFAEDLSSSLHRPLAPNAVAALCDSSSAMGPPLFDRRAEGAPSTHGRRTVAHPRSPEHSSMA